MSNADDSADVPPHLLGYRKDPKWKDMSDYAVHFTETAETLASILATGEVRAGGPYGWGRTITEVADAHRSACFSEIPLDLLDRLSSRHGHFGVGFKKEFLCAAGGARVWYLDRDYPVADVLFRRIRRLLDIRDFDDDLWRLTPFIDQVIPARYDWDWEREWRVPGGLRFTLVDVAFVITTEGARRQFEEYPSLDSPVIRPDDREAFWVAVPQQLGDAVDEMVATFLSTFSDPVEHLPWDEGGYIWIVDQWDTDDAIQELFGELEPSVHERMLDYLSGISTVWVRDSDLDSLGD